MTECPKCNGRGTVGYYDVDHFVDVECDRCHGQGEVSETDMTNEEWFCQLTTEEKAEWLTNSGFLTCTLRDCEDCKYYDKNNDDCIDGYEATHDKQMWVEWLKQPRTN